MSNDSNAPRVFVVDDEVVISTTLAMILRAEGFDARAFHEPMEALRSAFAMPPDLLISDVVMPQMSGIELAIQLRSQCPGCKVLLFSGQSGTSDLLRAARASGHDFEILTKPVHPTDLLAKVHNFLNADDPARLGSPHMEAQPTGRPAAPGLL